MRDDTTAKLSLEAYIRARYRVEGRRVSKKEAQLEGPFWPLSDKGNQRGAITVRGTTMSIVELAWVIAGNTRPDLDQRIVFDADDKPRLVPKGATDYNRVTLLEDATREQPANEDDHRPIIARKHLRADYRVRYGKWRVVEVLPGGNRHPCETVDTRAEAIACLAEWEDYALNGGDHPTKSPRREVERGFIEVKRPDPRLSAALAPIMGFTLQGWRVDHPRALRDPTFQELCKWCLAKVNAAGGVVS